MNRTRSSTTVSQPVTSVEESNDVQDLSSRLAVERKIRDGAENLLQVFKEERNTEDVGSNDGKEALQKQVEGELASANAAILAIEKRLDELSEAESSHEISARPAFGDSPASSLIDGHAESSMTEDDDRTAADMVIDLLTGLGGRPIVSEKLESMEAIAKVLKVNPRAKFDVPIAQTNAHLVPLLSDASSKEVRAMAYRLLRHLIDIAVPDNLHIYLIRTLARDSRFDGEKLQAICLIRFLIFHASFRARSSITTGTLRAVVAIAENSEEKLRLVALEMLGELVVWDIEALAKCEGLRVVLQAMSDGPHELAPSLAMVILHLADRPHLRSHLRPGVDLEIALSGLTEVTTKAASEDKMRSSGRIATLLLKSWTGLLYLCVDDKRAIRGLVDALRVPSPSLRETLLDTFFEIFRIKTPVWFNEFLSGKRLTMFRQSKYAPSTSESASTPERSNEKASLIDHYLAVLLMIFVSVGLLDALILIAEDAGQPSLSRKSALLIGEILQLSNRVLPLVHGSKLQALPRLFALAASFNEDMPRLAATSALQSVDSFNRNRARLQGRAPFNSDGAKRLRSNSIDDPLKRGQRYVETTRLRIGLSIDDTAFRNMILETQVLVTPKDHTRWNVDILLELFEGPLMNPTRLEEAIKGSKFGRRVLNFFHPFEGRYSNITRNKDNEKWTRLACSVINCLLSNAESVRWLAGDKLFRQVADCLVQLDPLAGPPTPSPVFSKAQLEDTLSSGYIVMLGVLTRSADGLRLMERFKIFTLLYHLTDLRSREDVIKDVIENMDYAADGHPRLLLSKALTSSYKHIRLFATKHVGRLVREATDSFEWLIRLLLTQLYDTSVEVCESAVHILEEACESLEVLELVVEMRPMLDHLGDIGAPLLVRFLSTSIGARYLHEIQYIDRELEDWFHERNYSYVVKMEVLLAKCLKWDNNASDMDEPFDGIPLPHFYGELVKTKEGCLILEDKGHFAEFAEFIRRHGLESHDPDIIAQLKGILWAVGNIGASVNGLPFLDAEDLVGQIVDIATDSECFSVRGTCCFVLGLLSSTPAGAEALQEYGWEVGSSPLGAPNGLSLPVDLDTLIVVPKWTSKTVSDPEARAYPLPQSPAEREAVLALTDLSDHLLAKGASSTLARLKGSRHSAIFASADLFAHVLQMMEFHHYRLPVRRYIMDLFNIELNPEKCGLISEAGAALATRRGERPSPLPDDGLSFKRSVRRKARARQNGMRAGASDEEDFEVDESAIIAKVALAPAIKVKGFLLPPG